MHIIIILIYKARGSFKWFSATLSGLNSAALCTILHFFTLKSILTLNMKSTLKNFQIMVFKEFGIYNKNTEYKVFLCPLFFFFCPCNSGNWRNKGKGEYIYYSAIKTALHLIYNKFGVYIYIYIYWFGFSLSITKYIVKNNYWIFKVSCQTKF